MLAKVNSAMIDGIIGEPVEIEVDIGNGLPYFTIVGMVDITIREAKDRIRSAIRHSQGEYPNRKIVVNLSPANIRKRGSHFDLPIAMGILSSSQQIPSQALKGWGFIGELSLDGRIKSVCGALPMVSAMRDNGISSIVVPAENLKECSLIGNIKLYGVDYLNQIFEHFNGVNRLTPAGDVLHKEEYAHVSKSDFPEDFGDVKGQEMAKRAITIAIAGGHGLLLAGSPSTGKTMLSSRIPSILPDMTDDEVLEATLIHSVAGLLTPNKPIINRRPFRKPHHTITPVGMLGGGVSPVPGEVSLATKGVLFMDEMGEFNRTIIENLRTPIEDKEIGIFRQGKRYVFPADFLLVAATNLCKCGYYGDETHICHCSSREVEQYQKRLSGPILDRIDIHVNLTNIRYEDYNKNTGMTSLEMRNLIDTARTAESKRFYNKSYKLNAYMNEAETKMYCYLDKPCKAIIAQAFDKNLINPRTYQKVLKISRTIADMNCEKDINSSHIIEAIQYRGVFNGILNN